MRAASSASCASIATSFRNISSITTVYFISFCHFSAIRFYVMDGTSFRRGTQTVCKVTAFFANIQIFERHSFEKVIFGSKIRRKREISQINGRKKKLLRGVAVFNDLRRSNKRCHLYTRIGHVRGDVTAVGVMNLGSRRT